jgi:hypothetical protein
MRDDELLVVGIESIEQGLAHIKKLLAAQEDAAEYHTSTAVSPSGEKLRQPAEAGSPTS